MRRPVTTAVLTAVLAATLAGPPAPSYAAPPDLRLEGHGWGHGHGMSQYGAQGAALAGLSHRRILEFYYPGTQRGRASGAVKVLISADTSADVVVRARPGLVARSVGARGRVALTARKPQARKWKLSAASPSRTTVSWKGRTGGWRKLRVLRGDAQFQAAGPITLVTPGGRTAYRGALRSASAQPGTRARDTVNVVPLDTYLRGVVPSEVIAASWDADALRAQAVAARTYAAFERRQPLARHYQLCDTSQCQVYTGTTHEYPTTDAAIRATRGQVLTHRGKPAFTQFSSSSGGWTADGGKPYLPAQPDPYDATPSNPNSTWTATVPGSALQRAWPAIGEFASITVLERDGHGDQGGRVVRVQVTGSAGSTVVTGDAFRSALGLKSDWFRPI